MPRTADHDARRQQVLDALCRITVRGGLDATTFREVAAEAGVSVRLVQYYFGTKAHLLAEANRYAVQRLTERLLAAVERLGIDPDPRDVVGAIMRSYLPTDREARDAVVVFYAFYSAQLANPDPGDPGSNDDRDGLQRLFADQITAAQQQGLVRADLDADREATLLFLILPSLVGAAIGEQISLSNAEDIVDYAISRVFGPPTGS